MPRTTFNRLSKKKSNVRKRRTSVATRARFQKPTARNQKRQILGNALAIRQLKRLIGPPVYTDWQYSDTLVTSAPDDQFSETLQSRQLMSPADPAQPGNSLWNAVLRQDVNVVESSTTKVLRMQINLRYRLAQSNWCQYTVFVVSMRRDSADFNPIAQNMVKGSDYITNLGDDFNVRLNPARFKVHYTRNVSLTKNSWVSSAATIGGQAFAGNPMSTFAKGQVNMKLNFTIRQPTQGLSWTTMDQSQFPPHQRLYLLAFMVQQQNNPAGSGDTARVNFDSLYTCYNAS